MSEMETKPFVGGGWRPLLATVTVTHSVTRARAGYRPATVSIMVSGLEQYDHIWHPEASGEV